MLKKYYLFLLVTSLSAMEKNPKRKIMELIQPHDSKQSSVQKNDQSQIFLQQQAKEFWLKGQANKYYNKYLFPSDTHEKSCAAAKLAEIFLAQGLYNYVEMYAPLAFDSTEPDVKASALINYGIVNERKDLSLSKHCYKEALKLDSSKEFKNQATERLQKLNGNNILI